MIGHVCDFARNWVLHQNDFKGKILRCVMKFVLSNTQTMATNLQTISYTSYEIRSSGFLFMQYFVWSAFLHFGVTFVTFLIQIMCSLMHGQKLHNFCFGNTSQVLSNKLITKKPFYVVEQRSWFFSLKSRKSFTFIGMGQYEILSL